MSYKCFLTIIISTVKQFYGEQFDSMNQHEKSAVIMKVASDLFGTHEYIMKAVAIATHTELNA